MAPSGAPNTGEVLCSYAMLDAEGERAGPPPPRTVHGGMYRDPGIAPGSRACHYQRSPKLMRG